MRQKPLSVNYCDKKTKPTQTESMDLPMQSEIDRNSRVEEVSPVAVSTIPV